MQHLDKPMLNALLHLYVGRMVSWKKVVRLIKTEFQDHSLLIRYMDQLKSNYETALFIRQESRNRYGRI